MSFNYGPLAAKAVKLIAKYGKTVTLQAPASPDPADSARPWRGPAPGSLDASPKGLVVSFDKDEIDGEHIRTSDLKLLLAAGDPALVGYDLDAVATCTVDGVSYGATNLKPVKPGDTALVNFMRLRNG